ncbi:MAG TPA: hypothetical protein VN887_08085 [Candidatus Angelobacter sp.]|nr:hypothetical protein [Candidatus Angelobacter sp.]
MTAEIAILNKSAVALAADSAVTIGSERSRKIFNTVNKLFTLSKHRPVGIMVYGSAQIMEVPWETIIKVYRQRLGCRSFAHLEGYAGDFLRFLDGNRSFFPASEQRDYFQGLVSALFRRINDDIKVKVKDVLDKSGKCTTAQVRQIVRSEIDSHFGKLKEVKILKGFSEKFAARLLRKFKVPLREIQARVFQKLPLSPPDKRKLNMMAGWLFVRDSFRIRGTSGVVIAGFGEMDIYPRLKEFIVEGVIEDKLRFRSQRDVQIGSKTSASIIPFAQSEVVRSFMEGMDPGVEGLLDKFLDEVFANYPNILLNHIPNLTTSAKAKAAKKTEAASKNILEKFRAAFEKFRKETLINPIVSTVSVLPKDELAAMAEALVSLTSFKRKFSLDAETVGGPIDVAVLSKGDGFVWIKRKHYFKAELNPHFLTNYFQDD